MAPATRIIFAAVICASPVQAMRLRAVPAKAMTVSPQGAAASAVLAAASLSFSPRLSALNVPSLSPNAHKNLIHPLERSAAVVSPAAAPEKIQAAEAPDTDALKALKTVAPILAEDPAAFAQKPDGELTQILNRIFEGMGGGGLVDAVGADDLAADVAASGLTDAQMDSMRRHSANPPIGFAAFMRETPLPRGGYLLGVTGKTGVYGKVAAVTGLTKFSEVYVEKYGKIYADRTADFMDFLTGSGEPVVFLVPKDALTHKEANMTKEEFNWLLAHPEHMKNVTFVFGAYDAAPERFQEMRAGWGPAPDSYRIAQRRKHMSGRKHPHIEIHGNDRLPAIEEFIEQAYRTRMVREKASRGISYFETDAGWFIIQQVERGAFITLRSKGDERPKELFLSRRTDAELLESTGRRFGEAAYQGPR